MLNIALNILGAATITIVETCQKSSKKMVSDLFPFGELPIIVSAVLPNRFQMAG